MSVRERVARAICEANGCESNCDCPYTGMEKVEGQQAAAAITAFLEAAAEQGWRMGPFVITLKMEAIGNEAWEEEKTAGYIYRAMLAAAPEFEWDK